MRINKQPLLYKQKRIIINNIINAIVSQENHLLLGHQYPDEDCISSMIAMALILKKFDKKVTLFLDNIVHVSFQYLLNICKYNSIVITNDFDKINSNFNTIIICDTPKESMLYLNSEIKEKLTNKNILKIEIDHHLGSDSEYIGDDNYCLVDEASSSCELIGQILLRLKLKKKLLKSYKINELITRNIVLSILTGIISDTKMGQFLKSKKERRYYNLFSNLFNMILTKTTTNKNNISNKEEVFLEMQKLTDKEEKCFNYIMNQKQFSASIGYVILSIDDMKHLHNEIDNETIVAVTKSIANQLAEESTRISLVVYHEIQPPSQLIQFRMRRSKNYKKIDLRNIIQLLKIENGGGHEGAIGFRLENEQIPDINVYVKEIITKIENLIDNS